MNSGFPLPPELSSTFSIAVTKVALRTGVGQATGTASGGGGVARPKTGHLGAVVDIIVSKVCNGTLQTLILDSLTTIKGKTLL